MKSSFFTLTLLFSASVFAYDGPKNPGIPADAAPVSAKYEDCLKDVKDVVAWGDEEEAQEAKKLCALRAEHLKQRDILLKGLAKLVATFDGATNHGHDGNLPTTISNIQQVVASCLTAIESQQYPHNIAIVTEPEQNAIVCLKAGTSVLSNIISL